jgi:hypothetical protein
MTRALTIVPDGPRLVVTMDDWSGTVRPRIVIAGISRATPQDARTARSMALHLMGACEALSAALDPVQARWQVTELCDARFVGVELRLDDGATYRTAALAECLLRDAVERVGLEARRAA